jgi:hypothetical protein
MKEKVSFLAAIARDMVQTLPGFADEFSDEGPEEIDERDVAELIASLEAIDADPTLWNPPTDKWLPRNPYAGMLQSCLDEYYRENDSVVGLDQAFSGFTNINLPPENIYGEALGEDILTSANLTNQSSASGRRVGRFRLNKKDPRWALVLKAKAIKRRRGVPLFPDNSAQSTQIDLRARMVLVGDWGSGLPNAVKLAKNIWNSHLQPELGRKDLHLVHLGDVYHAGLPPDYKKNFLKDWPVPSGYEKYVASWCLAGNHDMYSGGHGYFNMLKDSRFSRQNKSSYFLLENDNWQVFGLDTSFDPRDFSGEAGELYGEQAAWVAQKRAVAPHKKCLILTHHQPISAYDTVKENLERRLRPIQSNGLIDAWFWGHEHLCAVYDAYEKIRYPVLLGHGGFPEKLKTKRLGAPPLSYEWVSVDAQGYLLFGFAVLDFDHDKIHVQLRDESNQPRHSFTIS